MTLYRWTLDDSGGVTVLVYRPSEHEGVMDEIKLSFDSLDALRELLSELAAIIEATQGNEGEIEL